jgi:hypothetical protein
MTKEDVPIINKPELEEQTPKLNEDGTPIALVVENIEEDIDEEEDNIEEELIEEEEEEDIDEEEETLDTIDKPKVVPVDYEKKFSASTYRNQIVEAQNKELQQVLGDITKQDIPTEEEMKSIDPDWEFRSDYDKNQAIKIIAIERKQNLIQENLIKTNKKVEFSDNVVKFMENTPEIKGKEDSFYNFVTNPKNEGAPMDILLSAFLHKEGSSTTLDKNHTKSFSKHPALARSTTNGGEKLSGVKRTDEELKHLRTSNPRKYNELVRKGKL